MHEPADIELLRQYVEENSHDAFAELVNRHVNMVYSAALRKTGNVNAAEEITQAVFIILAQKANKLSSRTVLTGWLYQTARLTASNYLRGEIRRVHREQEAYMQSLTDESAPPLWPQLAPLLDDAMGKLREKERDAVALRFFEGKSFAEIATAIGITENAAKKRVAYVLDKLQKFFQKRGVNSTADTISETISTHSIQAAPVLLAKTVATVALAKGATASVSTTTLIKGALKLMAWSKAKTAIVAAVVVLTTAGVTPYMWKYHLAPNAWQNRFHAAYHLRNGELIRYIAPPYIPERMTYYKTDNPQQYQAIPSGPNLMMFTQDKQGNVHNGGYTFGPKRFPLYLVLQTGFHLKRYEFQGPNNLLNLPLDGDWIVSDNITNRETFFSLLEPILYKATKRHIIFKKQSVDHDVIVVHGDHFIVPSDGKIQLYAEKSTDDGYNGYGNLDEMIGRLSDHLNVPVINETELKPDAPELQALTWVNHQDVDAGFARNRRAELTEKVLKNLSDQTGFTFTRETRPIDVWSISERK